MNKIEYLENLTKYIMYIMMFLKYYYWESIEYKDILVKFKNQFNVIPRNLDKKMVFKSTTGILKQIAYWMHKLKIIV